MATPTLSPLLALGVGVSEGLKGYQEGKDAETARRTAQIQAKQLQQQRELQLKALTRQDEMASTVQNDQVEALKQQLQFQQQQVKAQGTDLFRKDTYQALDQYLTDFDTKHLNNFIQEAKKNPFAPSAFKNTVTIQDLNLESPEDKQQLAQAGISEGELDALDGQADGQIDWDLVKKRFKKVVLADGTTELRDILKLAAFTGYGKYATQEKLKVAEQLAKIKKASQGPTYKAPTSEIEAKRYAEAQKRVQEGTATLEDKAFIRMMEARMGGTKASQTYTASDAFDKWNKAGFDKLSQQELQANPEARKLVNEIELAHPISEAQQKELLDLNALVELASTAGQLSPEQTGLLDKYLNNMASYTVEGAGDEAKAAYGAFINQFRHNLFGSALTEGELEAFKEAYGTLGQKTGKVLSGLEAALRQVESKLQTISDLNNPAVIKFRTGMSLEQVKQARETIRKRIKFFKLVDKGLTPEEALKQAGLEIKAEKAQSATPTNRPPLEEIFK